MSIKVAIICADLNPDDLGGAEAHIVEIARELSKKDYEFHIFVGNDDSADSLFGQNVFVHAVKYRKMLNLNSWFFEKAVVKEIAHCGIKFDLLHAKQVYPQAIAGAKLKKLLGIPLYVTVQNPRAYREELVLKGLSGAFLKPFLWLLGLRVKKALAQADLCACVSNFSKSAAEKMGAKNCKLIPNGIDLAKFEYYDGERNKFEIGTTSTLIPRNGIDILIKAMPSVLMKFPEAKLKIAGEGPMKDELLGLISRLNVGSNVEFSGTLKHSEIPGFVKKSSVFVRPSRFEGFGVSFIEAMALGTPVITCPVGGIPDFLYDGETGFLVPVDDPEKLAAAITAVFEGGGTAIVENARKLVEERYDWKKIAVMVEGAYREIRP